MVDCSYKVDDFICSLPTYVDYQNTFKKSIKKLFESSHRKIQAMDKKAMACSSRTKKYVLTLIKSKLKQNYKTLDNYPLAGLGNNNIVAYPESDIFELHSIMTQLGITRIPVAQNPWNKKLMGFIDLKNLNQVLGPCSGNSGNI